MSEKHPLVSCIRVMDTHHTTQCSEAPDSSSSQFPTRPSVVWGAWTVPDDQHSMEWSHSSFVLWVDGEEMQRTDSFPSVLCCQSGLGFRWQHISIALNYTCLCTSCKAGGPLAPCRPIMSSFLPMVSLSVCLQEAEEEVCVPLSVSGCCPGS